MKKEYYRVKYIVDNLEKEHDFSITSGNNEELKVDSAIGRIKSLHPDKEFELMSVD